MKKTIILSIFSLTLLLTSVVRAESLTPPADGTGVNQNSGNSVNSVNTPPADGTGVSNSANSNSNNSSSLPPADGTGVNQNSGSSVSSSDLPPADGTDVSGASNNATTSSSTPVTPVTTPVVQSAGGGSSGGFAPSFGGGAVLGASTEGKVLGASIDKDATSTASSTASTTCVLFKTFMKKGSKNNKAEVIKLQGFLNSQLGIKLPLTGTFGSLTEKAVKDFQTKNSDLILAPWVKIGVMNSPISTGYFFKTTQYVANKLMCPNVVVEMPTLK